MPSGATGRSRGVLAATSLVLAAATALLALAQPLKPLNASATRRLLSPREENDGLRFARTNETDFVGGAIGPGGIPWLVTSSAALLQGSAEGTGWSALFVGYEAPPFDVPSDGGLRLSVDADAARLREWQTLRAVLPFDAGADACHWTVVNAEASPAVQAKMMMPPAAQTSAVVGAITYNIADGALQAGQSPVPLPGARRAVGLLSVKDGALVFGERGLLGRVTGNGTTFEPIVHSTHLPRWSYAAWALCAVLGLLALVRRKPVRGAERIADVLATDRPIEDPSEDALGLHGMARGLSRFLRNTRTEPSLTVAITGPWGSGKSSLLNLLERDVRIHGFKPVRFNAWHHQHEQDVVASMFSSIVEEGVPELPRLRALRFRVKLLVTKLGRRPGPLLLSSILLLGAGAFFKANPVAAMDATQHATKVADAALSLLGDDSGVEEGKPENKKKSGSHESKVDAGSDTHVHQVAASLSALLGVLGLLRKGRESLKAFGLDPTKSLTTSETDSAPRTKVGFHARFAEDFAAVTHALAPWRFMLLVDDLERCAPSAVLRVLEAINFLVTSGDCFVVLAVARPVLDEQVASALKRAGAPLETNAQQYLDKLINVEIHIPAMDATSAGRLLENTLQGRERAAVGSADAKSLAQERLTHRAVRIGGVVPAIFAATVSLALTCALGWTLGTRLTSSTALAVRPAANLAPAPPANAPGAPLGAGNVAQAPAPEATFAAPGTQRDLASLSILGALSTWAILCMLLLVLWRPTGVLVPDSRRFVDALKQWAPTLRAKCPTPRALKRFVNRVRFLAMQSEPDRPEPLPFLARRIYAVLEAVEAEGGVFQKITAALAALVAGQISRLGAGFGETLPSPASGTTAPPEGDALDAWLVTLAALTELDPQTAAPGTLEQIIESRALPTQVKEPALVKGFADALPTLGHVANAEAVARLFSELSANTDVRA